MSLPSLKKIQSPDRIVNQIQDAVATALKPLLQNPRNDGRLIKDIELVSGTPKTVEHGLGRSITGWEIARKNANANVWESNSPLPDRTLILNSSANVTISVWIY